MTVPDPATASHLAPAYVLEPDATRREDAMLPFKLLAEDSGGSTSVCEFTLGPWDSGPVLHAHDAVDEAFYVVDGLLEAQVGERRVQALQGSFLWIPRGTAHTFANASDRPLRVLAIATPGGIEHMFAEQAAHLREAAGNPSPEVMNEIGLRYGSPTLGPPIRSAGAPG